MVDPIQRSSTVPLPPFQTAQGVQDPLPTNAPRERERVDASIRDKDGDADKDDFADYLDRQGEVSYVRARQSQNKDAASEIESASVYSQPGQKSPI